MRACVDIGGTKVAVSLSPSSDAPLLGRRSEPTAKTGDNDAVAVQLTYWLVTRAETLRRPEVAAVVEAIRTRVREQRNVLLGAR